MVHFQNIYTNILKNCVTIQLPPLLQSKKGISTLCSQLFFHPPEIWHPTRYYGHASALLAPELTPEILGLIPPSDSRAHPWQSLDPDRGSEQGFP